MKYTPKESQDNCNVPRISAGKEFLILLGKILGILLLVYVVLGLSVNYFVPRMSTATELKINKILSGKRIYTEQHYGDMQAQVILDELLKNANLPKINYRVFVTHCKCVNAFAYPDGSIVVHGGLLKKIGSKNELAMVMAHELGHFANRDYLRKIGRGLVFLGISSVVFGSKNPLTGFLSSSLRSTENKFSQAQERQADLYALKLLYKTYHNAAGAVDFFERMNKISKPSRFLYFFSTHPFPKDRVVAIEKAIKASNYIVGEKEPLNISIEEGGDMGVKKVDEKYRCNVCGNEVAVTKVGGGTLVCCGKDMEKTEG